MNDITVTGGKAAKEFERYELTICGMDKLQENAKAIRQAVMDSFGGECPETQQNCIMHELATGTMQCWIVGGVTGERRSMLGCVITRIINDPYIGRRLQIFSMTMYENLPRAILVQAMTRLEKFAQERECSHIDAQTGHAGAATMASMMGMSQVSQNFSKEIADAPEQ